MDWYIFISRILCYSRKQSSYKHKRYIVCLSDFQFIHHITLKIDELNYIFVANFHKYTIIVRGRNEISPLILFLQRARRKCKYERFMIYVDSTFAGEIAE